MSGFQFEDPRTWFDQELKRAAATGMVDPNAMALSTIAQDGRLTSRTVLFKGWVRNGLSFYTNQESEKAQGLVENCRVCLLFYWRELGQQIRIEGPVEKLTREESDNYFQTRARQSQVGAWASHQSSTLSSYEKLEENYAFFEKKFEGRGEIPCPPNWGGFLIIPTLYEFWFAREGRLHERYIFRRPPLDGGWQKLMKFP